MMLYLLDILHITFVCDSKNYDGKNLTKYVFCFQQLPY